METRELGSYAVPVVGLGCNNFGTRLDAGETRRVVDACLEEGITFFDTADVYGRGLSEEYLGRALRGRRDRAIVATKFGRRFTGEPSGSGASARWIETAVEASLRRLGMDYIDLYQLHVPDEKVPIEETLGALDRLVVEGKVRAIGCSAVSVEEIDASMAAAAKGGTTPWVSVQNQYSLLHRAPEAGVLDACERHGLAFLPFFPLHSGLLTGKYRPDEPAPEGSRLAGDLDDWRARFYTPELLVMVDRLDAFCRSRGHTLLELAFSWLLSHHRVASVIAGATQPNQVRQNAAAAGWTLAPDDLIEIDAVLDSL